MQLKVENPKPTEAVITIIPTSDELAAIKKHVLSHFASTKVPGFREGKAPTEVLEKHVDQNLLQTRFIEEAVQQLYGQALQAKQVRVVGQPQITLKKFVPFTTLEFEAAVPVVGNLKIANYKQIKLAAPEARVTADDVKKVLESVRKQLANKQDVERPAKDGDQVWIDFKGTDAKGQPVKGADGKDYPLALGSNTFIPGFEDNLIGLKAGQDKTFTLTFPKDYGVKALQSKKVTFEVNVTKVQEVSLPKVDDELAKKAGPFQTLTDLKADIKKQLEHERKHEVQRNYESELIKKVTDKSSLDIPEQLIDEQVERLVQEVRQNATYRGQTFQEMLEAQDTTEEKYHQEVLRPEAEARTKASIVLSEIAELEQLKVTAEEVAVRLQLMKGQYKDEAMQRELDKPEARQDIASRLLTEKTVAKLVSYAQA